MLGLDTALRRCDRSLKMPDVYRVSRKQSSPPLEEYGVEHREVVRAFVVIPYSLTTPAGATRHPSTGGEL